MKILASCHHCLHAALEAKQDQSMEELYSEVPQQLLFVEGDPGYVFMCPKGHANAFTLQVLEHELLFESACLAFLRGAFREAVGSFAASRERFIEFRLRVEAEHCGVDAKTVDAAWKHLGSRSERQLGAYLWVELLLYKRTEEARPASEREKFRNEVVHHGKFPTEDDTKQFGAELFQFVRGQNAEMSAQRAEARQRVLDRKWHLAAKQLWDRGHKGSIGGHSYATVLTAQESSFDVALDKLRDFNPHARWHEDVTLKEVATRIGLTVDDLVMKVLLPRLTEEREVALQQPSTDPPPSVPPPSSEPQSMKNG